MVETSETASDGVEEQTRAVLDVVCSQLGAAGSPPAVVAALQSLRAQVGAPCVVAVVGAVNAGKRTFINALLGEDCAVVGDIETTATINHFVLRPTRPSVSSAVSLA
jgi:tRNA U34 5-carboxymethylaminomethyl modifying GTPase MnmE/TrmE